MSTVKRSVDIGKGPEAEKGDYLIEMAGEKLTPDIYHEV